jgi:hypothetical protein
MSRARLLLLIRCDNAGGTSLHRFGVDKTDANRTQEMVSNYELPRRGGPNTWSTNG